MKGFIEKAKRMHHNQDGFTLVELLVVLAILALLVGLVMPNFFEITGEKDAILMQSQHQKMRVAVFLYHMDTGEWPTEWSGAGLDTENQHQLWFATNDADNGDVGGWDDPYIDRPILQNNRWGGNWGVYEDRILNLTELDNTTGDLYTVLRYENVPLEVAEALDEAMDDGRWYSGAVQFGGNDWPSNHPASGGGPLDSNFLEIIIAEQQGG